MATDPSPAADLFGDEYEVVSFRLSWGAVSLIFFLLTLPARYLLNLQPWRPQQYWLWPLVPPVVIAALSFMGLLTGLVGLKVADRQGMAKMGVLLNAAVLAIILLIVSGWMALVYLR